VSCGKLLESLESRTASPVHHLDEGIFGGSEVAGSVRLRFNELGLAGASLNFPVVSESLMLKSLLVVGLLLRGNMLLLLMNHLLFGRLGFTNHSLFGRLGVTNHLLFGCLGFTNHSLFGRLGFNHLLFGRLGFEKHLLFCHLGFTNHLLGCLLKSGSGMFFSFGGRGHVG